LWLCCGYFMKRSFESRLRGLGNLPLQLSSAN